MAIESVELVRRAVRKMWGIAIAGLLSACAAVAQAPLTPQQVTVTSGSVVPFSHGSTGAWGQIYALKIAHNGSVLFLDSSLSELYQLAPGATAANLVIGSAAAGKQSNGSTLEASGSYYNAGIALDAQDTLYVTDRYGSAVQFQCVSYSASAGTWVFDSSSTWATPPSIVSGSSSSIIHPQDIFIGDDQTFYVSQSETNEIDMFTVSGPCGTPQNVRQIVTGLKTFISNVAVDHAGNLYFLENVYTQTTKRANGVLMIPAATVKSGTTLVGASDGSSETTWLQNGTMKRIDPASAGYNFKAMTFDAQGDLYLSSENDQGNYGGNVDMVLMVPNEGTPTAPNLVWNDAVEVAPVASGFPIAVDQRGFLWIPTGQGGSNWVPPGTLAPTCNAASNATIAATCTSSAITLWEPGVANLPASATGTAGTAGTVYYSFSKQTTLGGVAIAKPAANSFTISPTNPNADPTTNPAIPPCAAGATYPAFSGTETSSSEYSWCAVYPSLNATTVGSVSGALQLLDSSNKVIAGSNAYVNGVGQGAAISVLSPANQTPIASGLTGPDQVASDPWGNTYVADPTLGAVEMYPSGQAAPIAGTAVGTGLTKPTGVAVDGAGDLFIGDSGSVYMIPFVNGALAAGGQVTLRTGFGDHLNLAADGIGNVYVADADNKQVVKIPNTGASILLGNAATYQFGSTLGLTGPSAVAVDNSGDVFVADGSTLYEFTELGGSTKITSSLAAPVTGLAVDPSGSVYVAETGGVIWIPYSTSTGGFNVNGAVQVATTLGGDGAPFGVALDSAQNAYISYGSGETAGLAQVGLAGSINWGTIVPNVENDLEAQVYNLGNAPLTLTAFASDIFTGANAADYAIGTPFDSPACDPSTALGPGSGCYLDVALTPSNLSGANSATLGLLSNAANAPTVSVALAANIVPDDRNATTTTIAVQPASGSTSIIYPGAATITATVASSAGVPNDGTVTLIVSGEPEQTVTVQNGVATFNVTNMSGGTKTVRATYGGSGVAGTAPDFAGSAAKSTLTVNTAAPAGAITMPAAAANVTLWTGTLYVAQGQPASITATITSSVGTPTGTVIFEINGQIADPAQPSTPLDANGNAVFTTGNLPVGTYSLVAVYSGDQNYSQANISVPSFRVIQPSIQITSTPATLSTPAGTPATATLSLEPLVGFNQDVGIGCVAASMPQYSECTFTYPVSGTPTIPVGGSGAVAVPIAVTISTNVPVNGPTSGSTVKAARLAMAGILGLLIGLAAARRRAHRYLTMLSMAFVLAGVLGGITACTNIGYSNPPPPINVITPAGTYNIQIITYNTSNSAQNSLTTPVFTLPFTVSSSGSTSTAATISRPAAVTKK